MTEKTEDVKLGTAPEMNGESYKLETLLKDIKAHMRDNVAKIKDKDARNRIKRDRASKFALLSYIVRLSKNNNEDKALKKAIKDGIDSDEILFGYILFLSSGQNFYYTPTYLIKRLEDYREFLFQCCKYLEAMVEVVNLFIADKGKFSGLQLVFMDMFRITIQETSPYAEAEVFWDKLHQLSDVKDGYYLSAELKGKTLLTLYCIYDSDIGPFMQVVAELMQNRK